MKIFKNCLALTLLTGLMLTLSVPQSPCADGEERPGLVEPKGVKEQIHDIEAGIAADRDKIIAETRAIKEDHRKMKDAGKLSDKTSAARIKEEAGQDIKKRETAIKDLKSSISIKKSQRGDLMYGKGQVIKRRKTRK